MYFPLSVSRARVWLGVCLLLCLCALPWPTHAGVLLAVVSERAAPTALAAARRHLAQHPQDRVLLRTPAQWQQASAREQDAWLRSADSVLAVAVFGDAARALKTSLARSLPPQANLLAFNGEASLSLQSRWRGDSLRDTPPELLRDLSQETPPPAALSAAERQPLLARWLRARQWWQAGGADNAAALFAYALRPDAADTIAALEQAGVAPGILSGDRAAAVAPVARVLGLTAQTGMSPQDKLAAIARQAAAGHKVLMIGDGLNDGPALAAGHASIAPGSASDAGKNAADCIFLGDRLMPVAQAIRVARRTQAIVRQNFALAIGYNIVAVPLAFMGHVTPLVAAIAMSGSSLIVVGNALRLKGAAR